MVEWRGFCNFAKYREHRIVSIRRARFFRDAKSGWGSLECARRVALGSERSASGPTTTSRPLCRPGERCGRKRSRASIQDLWHYQVKYSEHCPPPEKWRRTSQGTCHGPPSPTTRHRFLSFSPSHAFHIVRASIYRNHAAGIFRAELAPSLGIYSAAATSGIDLHPLVVG